MLIYVYWLFISCVSETLVVTLLNGVYHRTYCSDASVEDASDFAHAKTCHTVSEYFALVVIELHCIHHLLYNFVIVVVSFINFLRL